MRVFLIASAALLLTATNGIMLTRHFVQYLDRKQVSDISVEIGLGMQCADVVNALDGAFSKGTQSDRNWIIAVLANAHIIGSGQAGGAAMFEITEICRENPTKPFLEALKQ